MRAMREVLGSAAVTSCRESSSPISLREADVSARHRCAAGAHIVFIGTSGLGSMVMRGQMTHDVLNQSFARHGASSSYIAIGLPYNNSRESRMVEGHFDSIGAPSACVIIKYSVAWVGTACRRRGALVLVDSIDNHRAYGASVMFNEHYIAMDAVIVQTESHAAIISALGRLAVVLPHPHGNLGSWGVASEARPRMRGVGFVVADSKNMPKNSEMHGIMRACCRANTTLYLVKSRADGLAITPYVDPNCTTDRDVVESTRAPSDGQSCLLLHGEARKQRNSFSASLVGGDLGPGFVRDPTHQRRYYDSPRLLDLIDVGIVWQPGHQQGGPVAISNRPPTRLHWWWSHGIPTIGYPMNSYLDAARRAAYPVELLNLTTSEQIEGALRTVAPAPERRCLQQIARRGAHLSSPWYASIELLAAICAVGERCAQPLQRARPHGSAPTSDAGRAPSTSSSAGISEGRRRRPAVPVVPGAALEVDKSIFAAIP